MRCWECRLEFDEINESQPVCPGCGQQPSSQRDPDFSGVFDEAQALATVRACEVEDDDSFDATPVLETIRLPSTSGKRPMMLKHCLKRQG
jgi:hypothetical protein